ncbi:MAG: tetraacyldisaccharide 4'-kinase [Alphaproteobacteria bacterium]|nr:tetraacyldisaccharide 4'-kinase [Alphaproteobacteria bacterium]
MHEPHFWRALDPRTRASAPVTRLLLTPFAMAYSWAGKRRIERALPADAGVPVICIGNLTLGGAGKTPVAAEVRARLAARGLRAATLSRGYRGEQKGPLRVDPQDHKAGDVGDEPLMLAAMGEAWIAQDRAAGARAMRTDGVGVIVMDDGHQNPALRKDMSLIVIDAAEPFGNGHVFPKGPLREPVARGLERADGLILMGEGAAPPALADFPGPILRARLAPLQTTTPGRYIAFAGIGRPERFFDTLSAMQGVDLADAVPYPDHHVFTASDLDYLMKLSSERGARLITTDKDHVRLSDDAKPMVSRASVKAHFEDGAALDALLSRIAPAAA